MQGNNSGRVIAGADVESLFPSLRDVECARIVSDAVMQSSAVFENVDYTLALKYLLIVGGRSHMRENGLGKYSPKWLGGREDLLTVGGEGFDEKQKWRNTERQLPDLVKKKIISKVLEVEVLVCMGTHVYSFGDSIFLQCKGGPIVMKKWDQKWVELLSREGIKHDLYVRYVDDC